MAKDIEALTGTDATDFGNVVRKHWAPNTTIPSSGDFTWVNQGSATVTDEAGVGMHMSLTYAAGENIRALVKTAPGTPYTVEAMFDTTQLLENYYHCGLCIRDSSGGRIITIGMGSDTGLKLTTHRYTSATSWNSNNHFLTHVTIPKPIMGARIADDGTNHQASITFDGLVWHTVGSTVSRTAWVAAPDQIGVYFNNNRSTGSNTAQAGGILVRSFRTF